jgi:hypothetical protein
VQPGILWAGSDDGRINVSRDGGESWTDVTPSELPDWALISIIDASPHDPATAWVAATRYKLDDFRPYLLRTTDYGATWQMVTSGIPDDDFTRVVREDPAVPGLLYAGTETGLYVSWDAGDSWQQLSGGVGGNGRRALPVVPIHDLIVNGDELVICTHGRSFWIMDDLTLLRQLAGEEQASGARLFKPKDTIRKKLLLGFGNTETPGKNYLFVGGIVQTYVTKDDASGQKRRQFLDAGSNPDEGVVVYYALDGKPSEPITLAFFDSAGTEIRSFQSKTEGDNGKDDKEPKIPAVAGLNRFVWNMRYPDATKLDAKGDQPSTAGPQVVPGEYEARLTVGGETHSQRFNIVMDPRNDARAEDLQAQLDLLLQIRDKLSETNVTLNGLRKVREQANSWAERAKESGSKDAKAIEDAAKQLSEKLAGVEEQLIQVKASSPKDTLNYPVMLNSKLGRVAGAVGSADTRPTQQAIDAFNDIAGRIDAQISAYKQIVASDVPAFNKLVAKADLTAVTVA